MDKQCIRCINRKPVSTDILSLDIIQEHNVVGQCNHYYHDKMTHYILDHNDKSRPCIGFKCIEDNNELKEETENE